jgi:tRNA (mo5U34)-methyltransferase
MAADDMRFPLQGFDENRISIPVVEALSDEDLQELNAMLPWACFVVDSRGRRFGKPMSATKRNVPQAVPDRRIVALNERVPLKDLTVLEIGCFEGVHTAGLTQFAKHVKACDSRISNVVKTIVRCGMFQILPTVFVWDVEQPAPAGQDVSCDVLHHVGVLYHLRDPVAHLKSLLPQVSRAVMLDTHYARPEEATSQYTAAGRQYRYKNFVEGGRAEPFSGMYDTAKWLLLDDLIGLLREGGFSRVDVVEDRAERNGARILIMAER